MDAITPHVDIPAALVAKIEARYPHLRGAPLKYIRDGFNNDIVIAGNERVCRFPKRSWGGDMIVHEARVLGLVDRHVELAVPVCDIVEPTSPATPSCRATRSRTSGCCT